MANYSKITDFAVKDTLPTGNPNKVASATQVDNEFNAISVAIATKEDTANKGQANGYASLDGSGDVPDSQVPTTVPRLSLDNLFTGVQAISGTEPKLSLRETDAGTDAKNWLIRANGGQIAFSLATDAVPNTAVSTFLTVTRSGTTVGTLTLTGTALTFNGNTIWHTGNDGSSSGLDADTVDGVHASSFAPTIHTHSTGDITSGVMADARIQSSNVIQHQALMTTRNITGRGGIVKTLSTAAASGGSDGDIWYRY